MFAAQRPSYTLASASIMSSGATVGARTKPSFAPAGGRRRGSLAIGAGSAWRGIPTVSQKLSMAMTVAITSTVSTYPASLTPPTSALSSRRRRHPLTAHKCQGMDSSQRLTEPEERSRHLIGRRFDGEDAVFLVNAALADNLLA